MGIFDYVHEGDLGCVYFQHVPFISSKLLKLKHVRRFPQTNLVYVTFLFVSVPKLGYVMLFLHFNACRDQNSVCWMDQYQQAMSRKLNPEYLLC